VRRAFRVLIVVGVASPAWAGAPVGHYEDYVATTREIVDRRTGLRWERHGSGAQLDRAGAVRRCDELGQRWRLPAYKELLTLVDEHPAQPFIPRLGATEPRSLDMNAFPDAPGGVFMSRDPAPQGPSLTLGVDVSSGRGLEVSAGWVRCVR